MAETEEFDPLLVHLVHIRAFYIARLIEMHGSRVQWIRAVGEPMAGLFMSFEEIAQLLMGDSRPDLLTKSRGVIGWAGFAPTGAGLEVVERINRKLRLHLHEEIDLNAYIRACHVIGIQDAYRARF